MLEAVIGLDACVTAVPGLDARKDPWDPYDLAVIGRAGMDAVTGGPRSGPLGKDADVGGPVGKDAKGPDGDSVLAGVVKFL